MLFQFLISSQRTLNWSDSMWRVYENSRVIFDLIEKDLQASVTSSIPGDEIPFFMGIATTTPEESADNDLRLSFVSSTTPADTKATSKLCEISYLYHEGTSLGPEPNVLYRQIVSNKDADWDFETGTSTDPDWFKNDDPLSESEFQKVVGGVKDFSIQYFFNSDIPYTVVGEINGAGDPAPFTPGVDDIDMGDVTTARPSRIIVTFDLFDENLQDAPVSKQDQTRRGFYKEIDLRKF